MVRQIILPVLTLLLCLSTPCIEDVSVRHTPAMLTVSPCMAIYEPAITEAQRVIMHICEQPMTVGAGPNVLMHGLLGHGQDYTVIGYDGVPTSCLSHLQGNPISRTAGLLGDAQDSVELLIHGPFGWEYRQGNRGGRPTTLEAHFGQFLWMLTECDAIQPQEFQFRTDAGGGTASADDLVRTLQQRCDGLTDLSFALPVYLRWSPGEWANRFDQRYTSNDLLRQHLSREERSRIYCRGAHWAYALAVAVRCTQEDTNAAGDPIIYQEASKRLEQLLDEVATTLGPDGIFQPAEAGIVVPAEDSPSAQLDTQAHTLAWVVTALSDERLLSLDWPHEAARGLVALYESRPHDGHTTPTRAEWHTAHALRLYCERINDLQGDGGRTPRD